MRLSWDSSCRTRTPNSFSSCAPRRSPPSAVATYQLWPRGSPPDWHGLRVHRPLRGSEYPLDCPAETQRTLRSAVHQQMQQRFLDGGLLPPNAIAGRSLTHDEVRRPSYTRSAGQSVERAGSVADRDEQHLLGRFWLAGHPDEKLPGWLDVSGSNPRITLAGQLTAPVEWSSTSGGRIGVCGTRVPCRPVHGARTTQRRQPLERDLAGCRHLSAEFADLWRSGGRL